MKELPKRTRVNSDVSTKGPTSHFKEKPSLEMSVSTLVRLAVPTHFCLFTRYSAVLRQRSPFISMFESQQLVALADTGFMQEKH